MLKRLCLISIFWLSCCFAQADRAALTGTISDKTGGGIPDAAVRVVYPDTGLTRETLTSKSGVFRLSGLPIGACSVEAKAPGFAPVKTEAIVLSVAETRTLDLVMDVAAVGASVEVRAVGEDLAQNNAVVGDVLTPSQLDSLPVSGREWKSLMALVPGAVDGGKFFATGGDDVNFHVDGVDASGVRDQNMKVDTRLVMSQDAVAEFRVSSAMYAADTGGTGGGQVEIVTKSGSNEFHGSAFEYLRNSLFDARTPFDPSTMPPFRLNQFGATLGGPVIKNNTFVFLSYEGFRQGRDVTVIGYVPSQSLRDRVVATSPVLKPYIDAWALPNAGLLSADIGQLNSLGSQSENEDVGTIRADHRFSDRLTSYFRFTRTFNSLNSPSSLGEKNPNQIVPTSGTLEFEYLLSPRSTNEFHAGTNWIPWDSWTLSKLSSSVSVSGLTSPAAYKTQVWHPLSESIVDSFTTVRGNHTWKAGVEIRRVVLSLIDSPGYTVSYASTAAFVTNTANTASASAGKPARTQEEVQYFGYILDEWKIKPNLTANLGLRYDMFNELTERTGRTLGFDLVDCGGYCKPGLPFGHPDLNNFAPRVSLAWSPKALQGKTVIRTGGGTFYGNAQLGDQQAPVLNTGFSYSLSSATTPNLAYPVIVDPNNMPRTAPSAYDRHRKSEVFEEWGLQVQQILPKGFTAQAGYQGIEAYHLSTKSAINLINPLTGTRPLAGFDQIGWVGSSSISRYHGLLTSLQRTSRSGLFVDFNYAWSHAENEGTSGGGGPNPVQNVSCRSCDWGNSPSDQRHSLHGSILYPLPFGKSRRWGGWSLSGVNSFRTGLPFSISATRKATDVLDGNTSSQRADVVPGVSLIPPNGRTLDHWVNPAAFAVPAKGKWGNSGADIVTGPGLFQIDAALAKDTRLTERTKLVFRADFINALNHPNLGQPNANISTLATFGRITSMLNTSPIGTGGARSLQLALRLTF